MAESDQNPSKPGDGSGPGSQPKVPPSTTRPPSQSPGADKQSKSEAGKWAERFFAFQRWVVKRFWSIIVLTIASQFGGYIGHTQFGIDRVHGRTFTIAVLIAAGVIFYWLAPRRARFMLNLCFLLLVGAGILVGLPLLVQFIRLGGIGDAWRSIEGAMLTGLGMDWLKAGVVLLILLIGGRLVGAQLRTQSKSKGGFKPLKESQPSASQRPSPGSRTQSPQSGSGGKA